ncbi:MAG: RNA methyltransferase [Candidatus Nanohaloarchaea archaeon]|nr:RNA methyltransferase [Candidatus Nanohaloarchaea archaeon]
MHACIVVEPEIEGNLGFLARTMANFDIEQLILVNPETKIGEEARNRAVNAQDILDNMRITDSLEEAIGYVDFAIGTTGIDTDGTNVLRNAVTPGQMAERAQDVEGDIGIVLGRESTGLNNEELEQCDFVVTIPASDDYPVMNITHAAAVIFYELFKHRSDGTAAVASSREEKEALDNTFKSILSKLDYSESERRRIQRCITNFIGRSFLQQKEAHTLLGFFTTIDDKLGDD